MGAQLNKYYDECCGKTNLLTKLSTFFLGGFNIKKRNDVLDEIDGLNDFDFSEKLFQIANKYLTESIQKVFNASYGSKNYEKTIQLIRNVNQFAGYKAAHFSAALKKTDDEDKQHALLNRFESQLVAESNLAERAARSAEQWQEFERTKHLYPNLEYMPSRSAEKRAEHKNLYGIIKPIDDPFWDKYLPPNGWNCKCRAKRTKAKPTELPEHLPKAKQGITGNAGKSNEIFKADHPFMRNATPAKKKNINRHLKRFNLNAEYGKIDYKAKNGSSINVHPFADTTDVANNYRIAKLFVNTYKKIDMRIRPDANGEYTGIGSNGKKNPEYEINGLLADVKRVFSLKEVQSTIAKAVEQGNEIVLFEIKGDFSTNRLINELKTEVSENPFKEIYIIKDNKITKYEE